MKRFIAMLCLSLSFACGGGMQEVDPPTLSLGGPPTTGSPSNSCGPAQLCSRTINECNEKLTQTQCEGWYAKASNCRDMSAYVACNCDCVTEATCSDYFACGNLCFNDFCK